MTVRTSLLALLSVLFAAAAAAKSPAACALLTAADVESVQGAAFAEAKQTESHFDGMASSRCFYRLPAFADSISVEVLRPDAASMSAQDLWQKIAGKRTEKMAGKGRASGRAIPNLGDAAIWAGNHNAGALYVLRGTTVLRISVGGAIDENGRIEKSRALALRALSRFSP